MIEPSFALLASLIVITRFVSNRAGEACKTLSASIRKFQKDQGGIIGRVNWKASGSWNWYDDLRFGDDIVLSVVKICWAREWLNNDDKEP